MNNLKQLHSAVTSLWSIIKKYHDNLTHEEDWELFMDDMDIAIDSNEPKELLKKWLMDYANYEDKETGRILHE